MDPRRLIGAVVAAAALALPASLAAPVTALASDSANQVIELKDDCDPATFNAVIGPGTCVGDGETTFSQFIAELQATRVAEDWEFDPSQLSVQPGSSLTLRNEGGETHTFTKVSAFGGGLVPILNQLSGNTTPAVVAPGVNLFSTFVPAGATRSLSQLGESLTPGQNLFECFIHPWMRAVVTVSQD